MIFTYRWVNICIMALWITRIKLIPVDLIAQVQQSLLLGICVSFCFSVITNQMLLQCSYIPMQLLFCSVTHKEQFHLKVNLNRALGCALRSSTEKYNITLFQLTKVQIMCKINNQSRKQNENYGMCPRCQKSCFLSPWQQSCWSH